MKYFHNSRLKMLEYAKETYKRMMSRNSYIPEDVRSLSCGKDLFG
jgi:hypothetical protein